MVWVYDLDIGITLDIFARNNALTFFGNAYSLRIVTVYAETKALEVKHDSDNIFFNTFDGGKFVRDAIYFEAGNTSASDARKQDAAKAVPKRHAVAVLQRFNHKSTACCTVVVDSYEAGSMNHL